MTDESCPYHHAVVTLSHLPLGLFPPLSLGANQVSARSVGRGCRNSWHGALPFRAGSQALERWEENSSLRPRRDESLPRFPPCAQSWTQDLAQARRLWLDICVPTQRSQVRRASQCRAGLTHLPVSAPTIRQVPCNQGHGGPWRGDVMLVLRGLMWVWK